MKSSSVKDAIYEILTANLQLLFQSVKDLAYFYWKTKEKKRIYDIISDDKSVDQTFCTSIEVSGNLVQGDVTNLPSGAG